MDGPEPGSWFCHFLTGNWDPLPPNPHWAICERGSSPEVEGTPSLAVVLPGKQWDRCHCHLPSKV